MQEGQDLVEHASGGLHHVLEDGGNGHGGDDIGGEHNGLHHVVHRLVLVQEHADEHLQHQTHEHRHHHEHHGIGQGGQEQLVSEDVLVVVQPHELLLAGDQIPLHKAHVDAEDQGRHRGAQGDDLGGGDEHIGVLQGAVQQLIGPSVLLQLQLAEGLYLSVLIDGGLLLSRQHGIRSPPLLSGGYRCGSGPRRNRTARPGG